MIVLKQCCLTYHSLTLLFESYDNLCYKFVPNNLLTNESNKKRKMIMKEEQDKKKFQKVEKYHEYHEKQLLCLGLDHLQNSQFTFAAVLTASIIITDIVPFNTIRCFVMCCIKQQTMAQQKVKTILRLWLIKEKTNSIHDIANILRRIWITSQFFHFIPSQILQNSCSCLINRIHL